MSTNDPSGPSSFEPPKPHEVSPHPTPGTPTPSEAANAAESAAEDAQSAASDAAESARKAAESTADAAASAPADAVAAMTEPVTAVTPVVETTAPHQPFAAEPTAVTPVVVAQATEPQATKAKRKHGPVRVLAILVVISGVILIAAGAVTWFVVRDQLSAEKITVSKDADHFAGDPVDGPWTAYAQADVINKHALEASGGLTYAQLPQDDPKRSTVMTASFLRASLYTSVVSFGVAVFAAGVGLILILIGWALLRVDHTLRRL